jgi:phage terminase large subunit
MHLEIPAAFDFLFDPPLGSVRYRAAFGGRGSAKSHSYAKALLVHGRRRKLRILCAREVEKSIKDSLKLLLDDQINAMGLGASGSGFYRSLETEIRGANGTLFMFGGLLSHVASSLKSKEGLDIAWLEEAAAVSKKGLEILTPTLRKDGSEIWATWNPDSPKDPIDAMFRGKDGPPSRSIVRRVNWNDNPWFPSVLAADMADDKRRDPDKYAHVWLGEYRQNSEARVFHNWRIEEFETPKDVQRFYFGADWGFSIDPTVLVRCFIRGRELFIDHELWKVGLEIDHTPAFFEQMPGAKLWPITADSARPETISYMQRRGFPKMTAAKKGAGSVEEGVEFLKSFDLVVHPRCAKLGDELATFSYKTDRLTGEVLPVLDDKPGKHVNVIDALRYAVEGIRNAPHTFKVEELLI